MVEKRITIINNAGLHTRPAATIVKIAAKFKSEFFIHKNDLDINGKSIIGVMTLAAAKGSELVLTFDGPDEEQMAEAILEYFNKGFDEL